MSRELNVNSFRNIGEMNGKEHVNPFEVNEEADLEFY